MVMKIQDVFEPYEIATRASEPARQCNHESQDLRFVKQSNGVTAYKKQCLRCGQVFNSISHDKLSDAEKQNARPTDPNIRKRFEQESRGIFDAAFTKAKVQKKEGRRKQYDRYLKSDK